MRRLSAIVCDDEPLAVERLERMLERLPEVEVAASFVSGEEFLRAFDGGADVLLLDVEMPRLDGFDIVDSLSRREWDGDAPVLIFVTAHSEFALDAFDSGAVDFLTKPVRLGRLERAIGRAREAVENREAKRRLKEVSEQLGKLKALHSGAGDEPHLWVRRGSAVVRLDVSAIDWIAAEGECVRFHCGEESYLDRQSISALEQRLAPAGFVRIHRSAVVNAARIEQLSRTRWGALEVRLSSGKQLRVSKSFQPAVRTLVKGRDSEGGPEA